MISGELKKLEGAIQDVHDEVNALPDNFKSDNILEAASQIMTIWISGYLQLSLREIFKTYIERHSDWRVVSYARSKVERSPNPTFWSILEQLKSFDETFAVELRKYAPDRIVSRVNELVEQRNNIAHGRESKTSIQNAHQQFEDVRFLVSKIDELFRS